ncbi:MAG: hypothetical protein QF473_11295 [Planctomycetota bacterium]|nr:hypothetical protein [Planctomycetota bacterium]
MSILVLIVGAVLLLLIAGGCVAAFAAFTKSSGGGGPAIGIAVGCGALGILGLLAFGGLFFVSARAPVGVQMAAPMGQTVEVSPTDVSVGTSAPAKAEREAEQTGVPVKLSLKVPGDGGLQLTIENLTSGPISPLTLQGNSPSWFLVHASKGTKSEIEQWESPNLLVTPGESQTFKISDPLDDLGLAEGDKVLVSFEQNMGDLQMSVKSNAVQPK